METLNKKTIIRLSTFILIATLLIPLSTYLFDEKISEEKQQGMNLNLEVILGNSNARIYVNPNETIRDLDTIIVKGRLSYYGYGLPGRTILVKWNDSQIDDNNGIPISGVTDPNGNFNIPLDFQDTKDEKFGKINVTAWFQGEPPYYPSTYNFTMIEVYARSKLSVTFSSPVVNPGDTFNTNLKLTYDNNTDLGNANAYIRLWNGTEFGPQTMNPDGTTSFPVTLSNSESLGLYPVDGSADVSTILGYPLHLFPYLLGSFGFGSTWANNTANINIVDTAIIDFDLSADPNPGSLPNPIPGIPEAYRGSYWVCLNGTLTDSNNQPIPNEIIQTTINGQVVPGGSNVTDALGYFEIKFILPTSTPVADINITTIEYNASLISTSNWELLRVLSNTTLANVDKDLDFYYRGEPLIVSGNLYDDQGNPVTFEDVSAFLTNQSIGYSSPIEIDQTDGSGAFSIGVDTSSVPTGNKSCDLNVTFFGVPPHYNPYFNPLITVNFFANPNFTEILLGGFPIDDTIPLEKSTNYDVEARLMDEFGRSISGRIVDVFWDGTNILSTDTDFEGKVYASFTTSDYSADLLPLVFSFNYGLGGSQQLMATYDFSLNNIGPTIDSFSIDNEEVEIGDSCTISVSGTDDGPLSNATLVLTDPNGNETRVTLTVITSLNFDVQFDIDTSQSGYDIVGNWTFYIIVTDREGDSSFSTQGRFEVTEKEGTDIGDIILVIAIIAANVLAATSGYFIAKKIRAKGGVGPFFQSLKGKSEK